MKILYLLLFEAVEASLVRRETYQTSSPPLTPLAEDVFLVLLLYDLTSSAVVPSTLTTENTVLKVSPLSADSWWNRSLRVETGKLAHFLSFSVIAMAWVGTSLASSAASDFQSSPTLLARVLARREVEMKVKMLE